MLTTNCLKKNIKCSLKTLLGAIKNIRHICSLVTQGVNARYKRCFKFQFFLETNNIYLPIIGWYIKYKVKENLT